MAKPTFGLFVEGREEPAVTSSDADLLQRLRRDPEFRSARTKVAQADADASKLFRSQPTATSDAGLEQRRAELRSQMDAEARDEQLRKEIKKEGDLGIDKETLTRLQETDDEEETPTVAETSKIEGPHTADGTTGDSLAEADAEAAKGSKAKK